ncbi:MAG: mechanosensitive ion channel family protein [Chloroflexi bacterium]|nr:MAG: mechanosensitive ion channel family protein [Chloroflexota bacterium]
METLAEWIRSTADFLLPPLQTWLFGTKDEPGHGISILTIMIVGAIMYYVGGRIVTRSVKKLVGSARHREWHKKDIEKRQNTLAGLFLNIWRIIIFVFITYALLKEFFPDVDRMLAPLFASAGIIGVAIGFGAQSVIKDFLSGIFIISENQYRVGDIVDIEGASGTVERIGTRSTVIRDVDGNVHYFPNGMVMHVINKTMGYSMARFIISVHPSSDIEEVSTIVNKLGEELAGEEKWKPKIIEAPAFVSVGEFTGNAVEIIIAGKTQPSDQWAVIAEMRRRLLEALEDAGIELAVLPMLGAQPPAKK